VAKKAPAAKKVAAKKAAPKKEAEAVQEESDINTGSVSAATGRKSIIQDAVDQLSAGKTVEEVRNAQKAKAKGGSKKKAATPAKKKAAPVKKPVAKAPPKKSEVEVKEEAKSEAA